MSSPTTAVIRVPGTTANLGPGFDTLGIALTLYNRVRVTRSGGASPNITSPIADDSREGATALVADAARLFFRRTRQRSFGFDVHLSGDVPIARGLGSSVTVRLGVIAGLDAIVGTRLPRHELFQLVTELEGHPDNAAPAVFGGFTASTIVDGQARCVRFPVDRRWHFVTVVPPFEVSTRKARELLPPQFSKADVVHNLTRVSVITGAFASADAGALRGLFDDRIHQPYREPLVPGLMSAIRAGERAGAIGGWLSGSGSSLICLTIESPEAVSRAMLRKMPGAEAFILRADGQGYRVRVGG